MIVEDRGFHTVRRPGRMVSRIAGVRPGPSTNPANGNASRRRWPGPMSWPRPWSAARWVCCDGPVSARHQSPRRHTRCPVHPPGAAPPAVPAGSPVRHLRARPLRVRDRPAGTPPRDRNRRIFGVVLREVWIWPLAAGGSPRSMLRSTTTCGTVHWSSPRSMLLAVLRRSLDVTLLSSDRDFYALPALRVENWPS